MRRPSPSGEQVRVIANTDRWNFDLLTPDFYVTLFAVAARRSSRRGQLFFPETGAGSDGLCDTARE